MKDWEQITHYAGFDWAKEHHEVVVVDGKGGLVEHFKVEHSGAGWKQWQQHIAAYPALAVAVETSQGAAVEQLVASGVEVYPVAPAKAKAYRERKAASGNKTDALDAWSLADALRLDGHGWRGLEPQDPLLQELRLLCRDEVELIGQRTALINQLQAALYEYYPVALEAFEDWTLPAAWSFVEAFATPELLLKAGQRRWEKFLHLHKLYRPESSRKRLECFARAGEFCGPLPVIRAKSRLALSLSKMLRVLQSQLLEYRKEIEKLFASHPDHDLFGSLPGAGPKLAPRLLSEIGSDRALFADPQALQCLAGTAPISYQSGQIHKVRVRRYCNKQLRHAVHLWANLSRHSSPWAATYYHALRKKGKSHACALRCLGQRWLKILWKMWQSRTCYDANYHLQNHLKHGSWVLKLQST